MMEEAFKAVEALYLALDALGVMRANYFWEGFDEFWDLVAKWFHDLDFSSIKPEGVGAEESQKESTKGESVVIEGVAEEMVATDGVVDGSVAPKIGEPSRGDVGPGEVTSGDGNLEV